MRTYPHPVPPTRASITGLGIVSPVGVGLDAWRGALRAGRSGVGLLDFSHTGMRSTVAARCNEFDPKAVMTEPDLARLPRLVPMALHAGTQALASAGLERLTCSESQRTGLILGTGAGGIDFTLDQARAAYSPEGGKLSLWTITNATHGNLAGELSIRLGLRGPSWCTSTGCGSSSDALGQALMLIRQGICDRVLVVGADAHVRWETLAGMELLKVISTRDWASTDESPTTASRPFDASRDGFVLGEGAWAVLLERPGLNDDARFGDLLGYG
ncbi:MAG TPA: beta-ketoacyl synthase, partial [Phycisphaerales bacterium]|nr:beta-ketoacyl synthase [Phycisphaerales bacterium]